MGRPRTGYKIVDVSSNGVEMGQLHSSHVMNKNILTSCTWISLCLKPDATVLHINRPIYIKINYLPWYRFETKSYQLHQLESKLTTGIQKFLSKACKSDVTTSSYGECAVVILPHTCHHLGRQANGNFPDLQIIYIEVIVGSHALFW